MSITILDSRFRDSDLIMGQFGFDVPNPQDRLLDFLKKHSQQAEYNIGLLDENNLELRPSEVLGYMRKPVKLGQSSGAIINTTELEWQCKWNDAVVSSVVILEDDPLFEIRLNSPVKLANDDTLRFDVGAFRIEVHV